jgi:heme exporter protein D|tara:strand:+ start:1271 stop:1498 length:228 start_codon:yes stop_codon:yes gene_type:complete
MINEFLNMNGYGAYVWSAFSFTFLSFITLYAVTKAQYVKETNKFVSKFGDLDSKNAEIARLQTINKEILSSNQSI